MGQDGHDRGAKVIASAFADMGFTVDLSDMFETPDEVAAKAKAMEVDVVGVSSLAAGHKTLVPELIDRLKAVGAGDIKVVCGGVIPEQDYADLRAAGVAEIFGPGSNVLEAANAVLAQVEGLRRNRYAGRAPLLARARHEAAIEVPGRVAEQRDHDHQADQRRQRADDETGGDDQRPMPPSVRGSSSPRGSRCARP